jgi:hypothetical protein
MPITLRYRTRTSRFDDYYAVSPLPRGGITITDQRRADINFAKEMSNVLFGTNPLAKLQERQKPLDSPRSNPPYLIKTEKAIAASMYILELGEDWDEEGSPGYEKSTWERATSFVTSLVSSASAGTTQPLDIQITPGPEGSIDVRWVAPPRSLLINFPAKTEEPITFYGSDKGSYPIEGALPLSSQNQWLLNWLTR